VRAVLAARGARERRAIYAGLCAGLRNAARRGLQGLHSARPGLIWVSADIAKGRRERSLPVIPHLAEVARDIRERVGLDEYVLPAQRFRNPAFNTVRQDIVPRPCSSQALRTRRTSMTCSLRSRTRTSRYELTF